MEPMMTLSDIYSCSPVEVDNWLRTNSFRVPTSIDTPEELSAASTLLAELVNWYAYLSSLLGSFKYLIRDAKDRKDKKTADALIDKKEMVYLAMETANKQRETISRMVTIKQLANEELKSLGLL